MTRPASRCWGRGRLALAAAVPALAASSAGCTVGSGAGTAAGDLWVLGCNADDVNIGTADAGTAFDLQPSFFAGQPTEDPSSGVPSNRLLILMERNGNRFEINDALLFDVQNAYEVGRCVRGRTVGGVPDWDTRMVVDELGVPTALPWCDWSAAGSGADGGAADGGALDGGGAADGGTASGAPARARINISTLDFLRSTFSPLYTCNKAFLNGVAVVGSWIEFIDFGTASQATTPPEMRTPIPSDFKVNFGERLRANFFVQLQDERVATAVMTRMAIPSARLGGSLSGFFDFILDRGRAAQPFP